VHKFNLKGNGSGKFIKPGNYKQDTIARGSRRVSNNNNRVVKDSGLSRHSGKNGISANTNSALKSNVTLEYKQWMDRRQFVNKAHALKNLANRNKLFKNQSIRNQNITSSYRKNLIKRGRKMWGKGSERMNKIENLLDKMEADHVHELQLGGADCLSGLRMLEKSINRSIGAKIRQQIKSLPNGTRITDIIIKGLK
jgi:hypothetical protein